jgi:hypothetical protein
MEKSPLLQTAFACINHARTLENAKHLNAVVIVISFGFESLDLNHGHVVEKCGLMQIWKTTEIHNLIKLLERNLPGSMAVLTHANKRRASLLVAFSGLDNFAGMNDHYLLWFLVF